MANLFLILLGWTACSQLAMSTKFGFKSWYVGIRGARADFELSSLLYFGKLLDSFGGSAFWTCIALNIT